MENCEDYNDTLTVWMHLRALDGPIVDVVVLQQGSSGEDLWLVRWTIHAVHGSRVVFTTSGVYWMNR